MKAIKVLPFVMFFCLFTGPVQAEETPPVVETFACNLASGQDLDDVRSANEFWVNQLKKIDDPDLNMYAAWMITPMRSTLPADFYWMGAAPNSASWGRGGDAYNMSAAGQAADARFAKTSECTSQVWSSEHLYGPGPAEGEAVLEVFGCNLHPGKTMSNVRAVEKNFTAQAEELGLEMNLFRFSPMYTNGQTDLLYFVGHDNMAALGATNTAVYANPAARAANMYFSLVMDCGAGIYGLETIKAAPTLEE